MPHRSCGCGWCVLVVAGSIGTGLNSGALDHEGHNRRLDREFVEIELEVSKDKLDEQSKGLFLSLHKQKISRVNDKKAEGSLSNGNSCYFVKFPDLSQFSDPEHQRQKELPIPYEEACNSIAILFH